MNECFLQRGHGHGRDQHHLRHGIAREKPSRGTGTGTVQDEDANDTVSIMLNCCCPGQDSVEYVDSEQ